EMRGDLVRAVGDLIERIACLGAVLLDDPECGAPHPAGDRVEPVDRPVELFAEVRPGELGDGGPVVAGGCLQEVSGGAVPLGGRLHDRQSSPGQCAAAMNREAVTDTTEVETRLHPNGPGRQPEPYPPAGSVKEDGWSRAV